jgi:hypothetical protein
MPTAIRQAARPKTARQFLSRGGTLSKWHPNYEFRALFKSASAGFVAL